MKKSIEDLRKRMSDNRILEETTQEINAEAAINTYKKVRFYTKDGISFPGIFEELTYVETKPSDNTSEEPLITKPK
jgi:hypothetical protein